MEETKRKPNRNYKDTMFRMLFADCENLLSLYNAINGTAYENPDDLEIITLENAVYMNMKNDLAFILDFRMYLYEHQSTENPNMPARMLHYFSTEMEVLFDKKNLYGSKRKLIPTPHFYVFYNGTDEKPERWEQRLSEAYTIQENVPDLELVVHVININTGKNPELMQQCNMLKDYSLYVAKVREYAGELSLAEAVDKAIDHCISNHILEDFLRKNRAEVRKTSIFEYDEERDMKLIREEEREIGIEQGIEIGKRDGSKEKLLEQVHKKLAKGKSLETIADELEETVETIQSIYESIEK